MKRWSAFAIACLVASLPIATRAQDAGSMNSAMSTAMSAAAKASPDLVGALTKEIGGNAGQAAGAAGALFGLAKSRLSTGDFAQVARAVPGMDLLLKAAPAVTGGGATSGLADAASAFTKLGLKPEMVAKAVPVVTNFVTKSGGATAGHLLQGVLK